MPFSAHAAILTVLFAVPACSAAPPQFANAPCSSLFGHEDLPIASGATAPAGPTAAPDTGRIAAALSPEGLAVASNVIATIAVTAVRSEVDETNRSHDIITADIVRAHHAVGPGDTHAPILIDLETGRDGERTATAPHFAAGDTRIVFLRRLVSPADRVRYPHSYALTAPASSSWTLASSSLVPDPNVETKVRRLVGASMASECARERAAYGRLADVPFRAARETLGIVTEPQQTAYERMMDVDPAAVLLFALQQNTGARASFPTAICADAATGGHRGKKIFDTQTCLSRGAMLDRLFGVARTPLPSS